MAETLQLEGLETAVAALEAVPRKVARRALGRTARAGAKPLVQAERAAMPRKSGYLARSITSKVKSYRGGYVQVAVTGQDTAKRFRVKAAAKRRAGGLSRKGMAVPLHLIENRVRPHRIPKAYRRQGRGGPAVKSPPLFLKLPGGGQAVVSHVDHPGHPGYSPMKRAAAAAADAAGNAATNTLRAEVATIAAEVAAGNYS